MSPEERAGSEQDGPAAAALAVDDAGGARDADGSVLRVDVCRNAWPEHYRLVCEALRVQHGDFDLGEVCRRLVDACLDVPRLQARLDEHADAR